MSKTPNDFVDQFQDLERRYQELLALRVRVRRAERAAKRLAEAGPKTKSSDPAGRKVLALVALVLSAFACSLPAMAERYQILPLATNVQRSLATYTALLVDSEVGIVFNCSAQFDSNNQRFAREECSALSVEGELPLGPIELRNMSLNYGWIPLWSVDQKSGTVTFCTALSAIAGLRKLWCVPVATHK